jgi:hypothetical protein
MDKYGGAGSDRPFWLEAYGGRPYTVDRVKDETAVHCRSLACGIVGCVQPDRLVTMLHSGDDDGLSSRFLCVWPEPNRPARPTRSPDDDAALASLRQLASLSLSGSGEWTVVPMAEPAADVLQQWREYVAGLEAGAGGLLLSWIGKLHGMAVRLALIIEYLWWCGDRPGEPEPSQISEAAVRSATWLLDQYALPMARRCFGDAAVPQAERDAVMLARWLATRTPLSERVNARDLRKAGALSTKEAARYDKALEELTEAAWLRPAPGRAGLQPGRQRKDYEINPALHARLAPTWA